MAQSLPLIAIGDYNFDYDFNTKKGNMAFQIFTKNDVWKWVRPEKLIDSNWADNNPRLPLEQRTDRYPDSILDFIFVAGPAKKWQAKSWVVVRPGDFPDSDEMSDHRPVAAVVEVPSGHDGQCLCFLVTFLGISINHHTIYIGGALLDTMVSTAGLDRFQAQPIWEMLV